MDAAVVTLDSEVPPPPPAPRGPSTIAGELVARARQGDREAREQLARECGVSAYRFALQLVRDREAAADLAQDALLRFFGSLGRFDTSRPVIPWLFRIVRNRAADEFRRRGGRRDVPLDASGDGTAPVVIKDGSPGPHARSERNELRELIWRCLGELAEAHREILVLRDYQDLSYREIAEVLSIPTGTVMSRLHAARQQLRKALLASGYDFGGSA